MLSVRFMAAAENGPAQPESPQLSWEREPGSPFYPPGIWAWLHGSPVINLVPSWFWHARRQLSPWDLLNPDCTQTLLGLDPLSWKSYLTPRFLAGRSQPDSQPLPPQRDGLFYFVLFLPNPESVQGQAGRGLEPPELIQGVPAHGTG